MIICFFVVFFQKEKGEKSTNWLVRAIVLEFACILQLKKIQQNLSHFFMALIIPRQPRFSYLTRVQKKQQQQQHQKQHCVKIIRIRSFSGPYFLTIGLNIEIYLVFSLMWEQNRKTPNSDTFQTVQINELHMFKGIVENLSKCIIFCFP